MPASIRIGGQKIIGAGALHTISSFESGFSGTVRWVVTNGICHVSIWSLTTTVTGNTRTVSTSSMPTPKIPTGAPIFLSGSTVMQCYAYLDIGNNLKANVYNTGYGFGSFSYPVAESWYEPAS